MEPFPKFLIPLDDANNGRLFFGNMAIDAQSLMMALAGFSNNSMINSVGGRSVPLVALYDIFQSYSLTWIKLLLVSD